MQKRPIVRILEIDRMSERAVGECRSFCRYLARVSEYRALGLSGLLDREIDEGTAAFTQTARREGHPDRVQQAALRHVYRAQWQIFKANGGDKLCESTGDQGHWIDTTNAPSMRSTILASTLNEGKYLLWLPA